MFKAVLDGWVSVTGNEKEDLGACKMGGEEQIEVD
jgi:hypothetical protein